MPTFWVLKNVESETGVSVFFVDEGIDSGPILVQKRVGIEPGTTQNELIRTTKMLGMEAIIEAINLVQEGNFELIPNDNNKMTYFGMPKREDVREFCKSGKRFF